MSKNHVKLGVAFDGQEFILTPKGIKRGAKGRVVPDGILLATLDKGSARRVRKALRRSGHVGRAATRAHACERHGCDYRDDGGRAVCSRCGNAITGEL